MFQIHLSQNQFCCLLLHYILHVLNRHFPKGPVVMSFEFLFTIWRFAISAKLLLSKRPLCQLIRIFVYSLAILALKNEKLLKGYLLNRCLKRNDNQSGSILFRFSWIHNILWDCVKASISRMFQIFHIPLLKLLYFTCKNDAE